MKRFLKVEYHTLQVKQKIFLLCLQQIKNKEPTVKKKQIWKAKTGNNQILVSTSESQTSDRRLKHSCFKVGALRKFHVIEGQNTRDHIAFYAFHSFLVEVQTNAGYICAKHA